jgi:hypothetical protein
VPAPKFYLVVLFELPSVLGRLLIVHHEPGLFKRVLRVRLSLWLVHPTFSVELPCRLITVRDM